MKKILLTKNKFVFVDDPDFEWLNQWKWYGADYAYRQVKGKTIYMHRLIMNTPTNMVTDHINGNGLDNQRENLRIATTAQNIHNMRTPTHNTSGYKGVSFYKVQSRYSAYIHIKGKKKHLGYFATVRQAAHAYDVAAKRYFGEFAKVNL